MTTECQHQNCLRPIATQGYCKAHYIRKLRGRDMDAPVRLSGSDPERFWQKVQKSDGCWEWLAYKNRGGYGIFRVGGKSLLAHRVSFERANGPIPIGLEVDHMCHNAACVKPDHLRLATSGLNRQNLRGARKDSSVGVRGVSQIKSTGKWRALARLKGRQTHLGCFDSKEEAEAAVTAWRRVNMPYSLMDRGGVSC